MATPEPTSPSPVPHPPADSHIENIDDLSFAVGLRYGDEDDVTEVGASA